MYHSGSHFIAILLIIIISITGCKTETVAPLEESSAQFIKKITQDEKNYSEYIYNNGLLIKYESYKKGKPESLVTLEYSEGNVLQSELVVEAAKVVKKEFTFDDSGRIIKINLKEKFGSDYESVGYILFTYNKLNQLFITEQYFYNSTAPSIRTEYTFDNNENLIAENVYYGQFLQVSSTYTYDNKTNPFNRLKKKFISAMTMSKNNILTCKRTDYSSPYNGAANITYTYTYDSSGYPVMRKTVVLTNDGGSKTEEAFEYK